MHKALATAGSRDGLDVHNLAPHAERLLPKHEPVTTRSHWGNFTVVPRPQTYVKSSQTL